MFAEERKHMIVDLVNKNIKTTVNNFARFSVSPATIRNDLRRRLEEAASLKGVRMAADQQYQGQLRAERLSKRK